MSLEEDRRRLKQALDTADNSYDPSTQVGVVLVHPWLGLVGSGFNQFPRGIARTHARLHDRETKLRLVVHGELDAILAAGHNADTATLYMACTDRKTGEVWGGAPCHNCTKHVIHAGIRRVVTLPMKKGVSKWAEEVKQAEATLLEAGVAYQEIDL